MDYRKALFDYRKKTITKEEMVKLFSIQSDEKLFELVMRLTQEELIKPVKTSGTNGNRRYPVFQKYRLTLSKEIIPQDLDEMMSLHPLLQVSGYLQKKPEEYRKNREKFQLLNAHLFSRASPSVPVSRKERSFEIFHEEKVLDDRGFCTLLAHLGLNEETLFFYDTPEYCFNDYIPQRKPVMELLICENKDIWFNLRRVMFEHHRHKLFGVNFDGVVYGCGNRVTKEGALTAYTRFMGDSVVSYHYWGDIDREGLNICLRLMRNNPDLHIRPFIPGYENMLRLARERDIPVSADQRERMEDYSSMFALVQEELQDEFAAYIRENRRIPQEIIPYTLLLKEME